MRPMNHAALALLQAANKLSAAGRGVTLAEMAQGANVSARTAQMFVPKLKSRGHLQIVGTRKVDYRNRPVSEYAPVPPAPAAALEPVDNSPAVGWLDLSACLAGWAR